jgi:hypothetical protein
MRYSNNCYAAPLCASVSHFHQLSNTGILHNAILSFQDVLGSSVGGIPYRDSCSGLGSCASLYVYQPKDAGFDTDWSLAVPFSNATAMATKSSPSAAPSNCCFVVQDTITENWWQEYTTVTYYQTMNATYITTLVSPYIDTTVTNVVTDVKSINATLSSVNTVGYNPATMMINNAPQPAQVTGASFGLNGSQIVTAGVTV